LENQSRPADKVIVMHGRGKKGDKIMRALQEVDTSHVMVVDDDDWVSLDMVESVHGYTEDYVGFDAAQMADGRFTTLIHQETASHICPTRIDLARLVPFGNEYLADIKWTKAVAKFVRTEAYVPRPLYFYDKWNPTTGYAENGGWSPARQVGWWPYNPENFYWG
jgi:hypothetical protein